MGRKPSDDQQEEFLKYLNSGRDEMNLIEHSFASASKNVDRSGKPVVFIREDTEPGTGKRVKREWKMSFSGEYGRPTTRDDDVFVACMKLSAAMQFADRKVFFTRYEMCRILGWEAGGSNYRAIDDAFKRLNGVQIVANKYFWDNAAKKWVKKFFHIIDEVSLYELEEYGEEFAIGGKAAPRSWFIWSEVMQESFDAGYVRKLDLEIYRSLKNPIARKLYRYLGKQFWMSTKHGIELKKLCHEKLGYSEEEQRNPRLRQKIEPAISELEEKGIYGLSHEFNASYGKCEVIFNATTTTRDKGKAVEKTVEPENVLVTRLLKYGIDRTTASNAVSQLTPERIVTDIEHVEYERQAKRVKSSPAGMLAQMLKSSEPWGRPEGFQSSFERERTKKKIADREATKSLEEEARLVAEQKAEERRLQKFNEYMAGLTAAEEAEIDKRAQCVFWLGEKYREALKIGDAEKIGKARQAAMYAVWKYEIIEQKSSAEQACLVRKSDPMPSAY